MPIPIITGFNVLDNTPIDGRYVVANTTARDNIDRNSLYEGLQVYVVDAEQVQVLTNLGAAQADDTWTPIGSDGGQPKFVTVTDDGGGTFTTQSASGEIDFVGGGDTTVVVTEGDNGEATVTITTNVQEANVFIPIPSFSNTTLDAIINGGTVSFNVSVEDTNTDQITYVINTVTLLTQSSGSQFSTAAITPSGNTFTTTATGTAAATASYRVNMTASYPDATDLTADFDLDLILNEFIAPPVFYTRVVSGTPTPLVPEADYDLTDTNKWTAEVEGLPPGYLGRRPTSGSPWRIIMGIADSENIDASVSFDGGSSIPDVFPVNEDPPQTTPSGYTIYAFPLPAGRPLATISITPTS